MTAPGGVLQRDPFACSAVLRRFEFWRIAVSALAAAALAALAGWALADRGGDAAAPWLAGAVATIAIGIVALTLLLLRVDAGTLRRDDGRWTFAPLAAGPGAEPEDGDVAVALDLGKFMLLVFDRHVAGARPARRWLPAQRAGLEHDWQALRCAVHAPRPAAAAGLAPMPE